MLETCLTNKINFSFQFDIHCVRTKLGRNKNESHNWKDCEYNI